MTSYEFVPRYSFISDITQAQYAVVTFTADHDFSLNEIISFRLSKQNGMIEINEQSGKVLSSSSSSVTVDIDTSNYTAFVSNFQVQSPPMAVPSTSGVDFDEYVPTMILEDAFDNRRV